ncbi:tyrosine-type recombinase/integrase [Streptomyces sp. NPDC001380]|uniref:tyrosine-type recombinase/integrase n=1 Tax=Streptomyces sp. NPDC001380 TaxID=3364566 RepID=UPI0036A23A59
MVQRDSDGPAVRMAEHVHTVGESFDQGEVSATGGAVAGLAGVGDAEGSAVVGDCRRPVAGPGPVFATANGTPIEPRNLNRRGCGVRERAGRTARFHGLRHTGVTLLLGLGAPPHVVRDIVGHSALDVTMNICAHVGLSEERAAPDRLVGLLDGRPRCRRHCRQNAPAPLNRSSVRDVRPAERWRPRQDSNLRPSA